MWMSTLAGSVAFRRDTVGFMGFVKTLLDSWVSFTRCWTYGFRKGIIGFMGFLNTLLGFMCSVERLLDVWVS